MRRVTLIDDLGATALASRYEALRTQARSVREPPSDAQEGAPLDAALTIRRETTPGGWYASFRLARGLRLRIAAPTGGASVAALLWNAEDASERLNPGDSMKIQWRAKLGFGDLLYSDMGRPLATIVQDSGAGHDALVGAAGPSLAAAAHGLADPRNSRDNFRAGAAKLGLDRRDIGGCVTFFAPVAVAADGAFVWRGATPPQPASVTLRAEMDLLLVLSNCPHPLAPDSAATPEPIELTTWRGPLTPPDDPFRNRCEEARRAFENLESWLRERPGR